jgi:integrase
LPSSASHNEKTGELGEILLADSNCLERKAFPYRGKPITKMYNSGWKAARRRAAARYEPKIGLPCPKGFWRIRVHDLKRTLSHRLRGAGVSFEDRQLLLGHKVRAPMTTHYSAADVGVLIEASERVCKLVALEPERASGALVRNARSRALG